MCIGIDEKTLLLPAVEVTCSTLGGAPPLPELRTQILSDERIGSMASDGAYDTRKYHDTIALHSAAAVIVPRKNAKP